jgi:hypothetical protein
MKIISIIIFFFITNRIFCQEQKIDSIIESKIKFIKENITDTIGIIKSQCISMIIPKCGYENYYILWSKNKKTYIQKINKCESENIKIDSTNYFFNFYFENQKVINSENVKNFETEDGGIVSVDHYCESVIKILMNNIVINKIIESYKIEHGENFSNKNYEFNKSLKIVELEKNSRLIINKLFN